MTREEVVELLSDIRSGFNCFDPMEQQRYHALSEAIEALKAQDTSWEQVVRCKDCKHRDPEDYRCDCGHDILWQLPRWGDWFCADGERKDGDNGC